MAGMEQPSPMNPADTARAADAQGRTVSFGLGGGPACPSPSVPGPAAVPEPETLALKTTAHILKQSERWVVPRRITAESTTGFITIDFTRASCAHREVSVEAVTRTGRIWLIFPDGWAARVDPSSTNTSQISNKAIEAADPDAPTIVVTAHPVHGYVKIKQRRRR